MNSNAIVYGGQMSFLVGYLWDEKQ
jgi:hypothetical protein